MLKIKATDLSRSIKEIIEEMSIPQELINTNIFVRELADEIPVVDAYLSFTNIKQFNEFIRRIKGRCKGRYLYIEVKKEEDKHD